MSIEAFEHREHMLTIHEKMLEAQLQKASGVPMLDFDDAICELETVAR